MQENHSAASKSEISTKIKGYLIALCSLKRGYDRLPINYSLDYFACEIHKFHAMPIMFYNTAGKLYFK
jgi:hypothetical protein